ncbi:MAG: hypothetical protein ACTSWY_15785 [Promethearchaeota archaeon]
MSERNSNSLLAIAILIGALVYLEYTIFFSMGNMVGAYISAEEEIDTGTLIFYLAATINLIILSVSGIMIAMDCMSSKEKASKAKISAILVMIALIIFLIQIVLGFIVMMGIL